MARTVVVVDDDEDVCEFLSDFLTSEGVVVTTCAHTDEAFEKIRAARPDVVVLDLQTLQDREAGLVILVQLRANPETVTLPVILITADHDALRRHAARIKELGATPLPKPFEPDRLRQMIESLAA